MGSQSMCIYCNDEMYVGNPSAIENFLDTTSEMVLCVKFVDTFIMKKISRILDYNCLAKVRLQKSYWAVMRYYGCAMNRRISQCPAMSRSYPRTTTCIVLFINNMKCLRIIYSPYIIYNSYLHSCRKCHVQICCSSSRSTATITSIQFHPTSNGRTCSG